MYIRDIRKHFSFFVFRVIFFIMPILMNWHIFNFIEA